MDKFSKSPRSFFCFISALLLLSCNNNNLDALYNRTVANFNSNPKIVSYPPNKIFSYDYLALCKDSLKISPNINQQFELRIWGNFLGLAETQKLTQIIIEKEDIKILYHSFHLGWNRQLKHMFVENIKNEDKVYSLNKKLFADFFTSININLLFDSTKRASLSGGTDGDVYIIELLLNGKTYYSYFNNPFDSEEDKTYAASKELVLIINFLNKTINSNYH
jgi:hypothetical protein